MNTLEGQVAAVNKVNGLIVPIYEQFVPVFAKLMGQVVYKQDGSFLKKIEKLLPPLPEFPNTRVYVSHNSYTISIVIYVSIITEGEVRSAREVSVYLADVRNGVITRIYDKPEAKYRRTDYTVEEIQEKRRKVKEAEAVLSDAKGELFPFGEYDR